MAEKREKLFAYGFICIFVGVMLSVFQQTVGINAVLYYAPRIFADMGMNNPMMQTVIMGIVNITFTLVAVFTVEKLGRKPLLITGSLGMAIGAFGVAVTFGNEALSIVTMLSIMVYSACFMFSWGPICWVYISELFPDDFGHWFTYGLYGIICVIAALFVWKLVPETKGKSLEDMSRLWRERNKK